MRTRLALILPLIIACGAPAAHGQGAPLPWGQSSDQVAWETYAQVTAPSGIPGSANVEFETWASDDDIYNTSPPKWPAASAPKLLHASVLNLALAPHAVRPFSITPGACIQPGNAAAGAFPATACLGEEVRRNWASFQYIVGNGLYSQAGLAEAASKGLSVSLPADAVEVKADWARVSDLRSWLKDSLTVSEIRAQYHTNFVKEGGANVEYALLAFHFSTKQIKNWVWADFEHERNPGRCDDTGCHDGFGAAVSTVVAKNSRASDGTDINGNQDYGACAKSVAAEAMLSNAGVGGEWRHYCLKGSQIDFVAMDGASTILGNSVIERINANVPVLKSSCITCHAAAAFRKDGSANDVPNGPVGRLDPALIAGMVPNDFIWGVNLAH